MPAWTTSLIKFNFLELNWKFASFLIKSKVDCIFWRNRPQKKGSCLSFDELWLKKQTTLVLLKSEKANQPLNFNPFVMK